MFILTIHDRNGQELKEGDIVRLSNGKSFTFYSEVKFLPERNAIAPLETFAYHSIEKVDKVPDTALKSLNQDYQIWFDPTENAEADLNADEFKKYLASWRDCEVNKQKRAYQITKQA